MKHPVVLLEDVHSEGKRTAALIRLYDPCADITIVDEVSDAKKELREHPDIAYIIVDLFMDRRGSPESGCDFVEWVLASEQISKPPILILTSFSTWFENQIEKFGKSVPSIKTVKRAKDLNKVKGPLHKFIVEALHHV